MESPGSLLETLRARLREVQTKLVEINALRREEERLSALIRHYESVEGGLDGLPDATQMDVGSEAAPFSLPRKMAITVRKLLTTDLGPDATVPELFNALPKSLRNHYRGPNARSNIETLRTQIQTWKDETGLVYENGRVTFDPNTVQAMFHAGELVLRTGPYRCTLHGAQREFKQDRQFEPCPLGSDCAWEFAKPRSRDLASDGELRESSD